MPHSILVVDDEPDLLEVIGLELELAGFSVHKAINGTEALKIIRDSSIDIVLSDIRMPNGDGLGLLSSLMEECRFSPPLVFMSGYSDCDEEQAFHRGAVGYFHKPPEMSSLIKTLREYVEPSSQRWKKPSSSEVLLHLDGSVLVAQEQSSRVDLGRGGFFVQTQSELSFRIEQMITFGIELDSSRKILGEGMIRWIRRAETSVQSLGVEIVSMTEKSISLFDDYIRDQKIQAYIPIG